MLILHAASFIKCCVQAAKLGAKRKEESSHSWFGGWFGGGKKETAQTTSESAVDMRKFAALHALKCSRVYHVIFLEFAAVSVCFKKKVLIPF